MKLRRILLTALVALLASTGIVVATSTPALASFSQCPAGIGCLWIDANGGGTRWDLPISVYHANVCHNMSEQGSAWVNTVSSAEAGYSNGYGIEFFTSTNCDFNFGWARFLPHLQSVTFGGLDNDNWESFRIQTA